MRERERMCSKVLRMGESYNFMPGNEMRERVRERKRVHVGVCVSVCVRVCVSPREMDLSENSRRGP